MYLPSYGAQFLPREHSSDFVLRVSVSELKKDSETPRNYPRAFHPCGVSVFENEAAERNYSTVDRSRRMVVYLPLKIFE